MDVRMEGRTGVLCKYKGCKSQFYQCRGKGIRFFRFPKDENQCRKWLKAAGREDLLRKNCSKLYKSYRLCNLHFRKEMYMGPDVNKSRLLPLAVPNSYEGINSAIAFEKTKSLGCSIETQTPNTLSKSSRRNKELLRRINKLKAENRILKSKLKNFVTDPVVNDCKYLCDRFLRPDLIKFVRTQLDLINSATHDRKDLNEFNKLALSLYFLGPKCYKQLQKAYALPSKETLEIYARKIHFSVGLNEQLFDLLKLKVSRMSEEDRLCTICINEMSLKTNEVGGLEDDGSKKNAMPASTAAVVMARGLRYKWKQPLGYIFSQTYCTAEQTKKILEEYIEALSNIGLNVIILVSNMEENFVQLFNLLGITPENPKFVLGGKELFYYFDPSDLIRATRNMLLNNEFHWEGKRTSWKYIESFYYNDSKLTNRLAPRLTEQHIHPNNFDRQKVKLATQTLSATVAAGLKTYVNLKYLPEGTVDTAEVISRFDKLFDIFNSSGTSTSEKIYNRAFVGQQEYISFLKETLEFLKKVEIYDTKGRKTTNYMKIINGWMVSINSLLLVWNTLKQSYNFKFLFTRRINQDCLENFFESIRHLGGNVTNPTPIQFTMAFKKLFLFNYFHFNCSENFNQLLLNK